MDIQIINDLQQSGVLTELYKAGVISSKIFEQRDIYLWVQAQIKTRGISKNKAVIEAEVKFNKGRNTIYRAIEVFENKK